MKEEKVIKSLKITSIAFGLILGLLSIFLVLNESFALFTSSTESVTYSIGTHKMPVLVNGSDLQTILTDIGYYRRIDKVVFETDKDVTTIDASVGPFDLSNKQDSSVVGYIVDDPDIFYSCTLYIATPYDEVYANPDSSYLFSASSKFLYLNEVDNIRVLNTSKATNMNHMFANLGSVTLDLSNFDTSNLTDMSYMFHSCSNLTSIDLSSFDVGKVTNMSYMFNYCTALSNLNLGYFNSVAATTMFNMFAYCGSLTNIDLGNFYTNNVSDMQRMFYECSGLTSLNLLSFNTSSVTKMNSMFYGCSSLTSINLDSFDTSNVTDMNNMFRSCSFVDLDLSHFNTSNVTNMGSMFCGCSSLIDINLNNFDTSNVTNMSLMFDNCSSLTSLDLSNFNTSKVTRINRMFFGCTNLVEIKLNNAEFRRVSRSWHDNAFPSDIESHIYLKDTQTNRDFMSTNFSNYTNITWV